MNGTTLRIASVAACVAALAAPSAALAKKNRSTHRADTRQITVVVPHDFDAGGNGIELIPGYQAKLFDPLQLAISLRNRVLGQLGLPPVQLPPTP